MTRLRYTNDALITTPTGSHYGLERYKHPATTYQQINELGVQWRNDSLACVRSNKLPKHLIGQTKLNKEMF